MSKDFITKNSDGFAYEKQKTDEKLFFNFLRQDLICVIKLIFKLRDRINRF